MYQSGGPVHVRCQPQLLQSMTGSVKNQKRIGRAAGLDMPRGGPAGMGRMAGRRDGLISGCFAGRVIGRVAGGRSGGGAMGCTGLGGR